MRSFFDNISEMKKDLLKFKKDLQEWKIDFQIKSEEKHDENESKSDEEDINEKGKHQDKDFCDVTLACVDKHRHTHKLIFMENQNEYVAGSENNAEGTEKDINEIKLDLDKNHDEQFHDKTLPPCNVCHKVFSFKNDLSGHMRTHIEDDLNVCSLCDKKFSQNGELYIHNRRQLDKFDNFLEKCCEKGRLLPKKHHQNFIYEVF